MQGIKSEADNDNCKISSGHSYQSNEPGITININGEIDIVSSKSSAKEGDLIYLSVTWNWLFIGCFIIVTLI